MAKKTQTNDQWKERLLQAAKELAKTPQPKLTPEREAQRKEFDRWATEKRGTWDYLKDPDPLD